MKFEITWMEQKKNHPKWRNSDPDIQTWYVITYKWLLAVKDSHSTSHKETKQQGGLKTGGIWIFLKMGNIIDIKGGLGASGDGNRRNQVGKDGGIEY